eukprot:3975684-Prymnesium_polylepis.1
MRSRFVYATAVAPARRARRPLRSTSAGAALGVGAWSHLGAGQQQCQKAEPEHWGPARPTGTQRDCAHSQRQRGGEEQDSCDPRTNRGATDIFVAKTFMKLFASHFRARGEVVLAYSFDPPLRESHIKRTDPNSAPGGLRDRPLHRAVRHLFSLSIK